MCCLWCKRRKKKTNGDGAGNGDNAGVIELNDDNNVPYTSQINEVKPGQLISIQGKVQRKCKRFSINFLSGKAPQQDIAFHFNPRLEQRYVVRNCRISGYWGQEETSSVMPFDFSRGAEFKVDIFATEKEFMATVNGRHWCSFSYRLPLNTITAMEVRGLVDVIDVKFKVLKSYPEIIPRCEEIQAGDGEHKKYTMPYFGRLSRKFDPGWSIEVTGRTKLLPQNFYVNLQDGPQLWPHPAVPLHLNPRFCTSNGIDVFVRNAWVNGDWGQEERAPVCPFLAGMEFKFRIQHENEAFSLWTESGMIAEFRFRCPPDNAEYLYIVGDVEIFNVRMVEGRGENKNDS